jgi:DNA-binding beta-propeller fold protein YncE
MAFTHDGSKLFVIAGASYDFIVPIDVATLTSLTRIPLAGSIFSMAISPDGNTLLAALNNNHVVTPIDIPSLTPLTDISVGLGAPVSIAIDSLNNIAYVANTNSHTITPIDLNTLTPLTDIQIPSGDEPQFIAITPDNTKLFSLNVIGNSVTPIDITGTPVVLTDIAVGTLPQYCVFNSDKALITNFFSSNVTPIDLATLTALTNISVASQPSQAGTYIPSNVPFAPSNFSGKRIVTKSIFEKDLINSLFWTPPVSGSAAFYKIFRDSALTDLAGTVSGNITIFNDHNRKNGVVYTYFLVAVDANGVVSAPVFLSFP